MLQLSLIRLMLAANIAGSPFAYEARDKSGDAPASEQWRR